MGEETVEAITASAGKFLFKTAIADPSVNIAIRRIKQTLYLRQKLLPAPKAQTRSDERQRLAVCVSLHLMHEPGRIAIQEIRGLIFRGKSPEKSLCRTVDHNPIEMAAAESRLAAAIFPCPCLAIPASHVADDGLDATDAGR